MIVLLFVIVGMFLGSAVWVVGKAQAAERPLFSGPICADCAAALPLRGWLPFLGLGRAGRCGACGARQPPTRILFEVLVAAYAAAAAWQLGFSPDLMAALAFALPLLIILLVDTWTHYIYTGMIVAGGAIGLAFALVQGTGALGSALLAAAAAAAFFALCYALAAVIYGDADGAPFGLGDVYLAAMIGAMTGFPAVAGALFAGAVLAAAAGLILVTSRRATRRDPIAYGPYLCLGALLTLLAPG